MFAVVVARNDIRLVALVVFVREIPIVGTFLVPTALFLIGNNIELDVFVSVIAAVAVVIVDWFLFVFVLGPGLPPVPGRHHS